MRLLVRKNLIAHRKRNKLSSIIYSMTLGAVIFLVVSSTLTLQQISASADEFTAADIYLEGWTIPTGNTEDAPMPQEQALYANLTDPILEKYQDKIRSFAYVTDGFTR